jgi:hypothetical protein
VEGTSCSESSLWVGSLEPGSTGTMRIFIHLAQLMVRPRTCLPDLSAETDGNDSAMGNRTIGVVLIFLLAFSLFYYYFYYMWGLLVFCFSVTLLITHPARSRNRFRPRSRASANRTDPSSPVPFPLVPRAPPGPMPSIAATLHQHTAASAKVRELHTSVLLSPYSIELYANIELRVDEPPFFINAASRCCA